MFDSDLFEAFEKLVEIEISGEKKSVPENNSLVRSFQFLSLETVTCGEFRWNGDCANCQIRFEDTEREKPKLACRTIVRKELKITRLSNEVRLKKQNTKKKLTEMKRFKGFLKHLFYPA